MSDQNKNGSDPPQPLDAGLEAAFGLGSVLESLAPRLGERGKVLLREEETGQGSPVINPRAAEAAGLTKGRGNYQLLGEIARGGMGTVFKGHDQDLGRDVALKVLHKKLSEDPAILQRFVEEAQIGGQLQHPGIVPVYELGLMADDRPFFTMKLVKGRTLADLLKARKSPDEDRHRLLSIFEQICQTLAYAHSKGVIHRDLKPANVMVGAFGEVQVVDWGLAKVLGTGRRDDSELDEDASQISVIETVRSTDTDGSASMAGSVLGTPAYMPPEQAQGNVEELDERADVFALGAVLMTILTGQPPYVGPRKVVLTMAAQANHVEALERLADCKADPELVELCIECLSPDMQLRPAKAGELAARITAHLASLAERAQRAEVAAAEEQVRATEALARVAQERHARRLTMGLAAAMAVAMLGIGGWMWGESQRAERVREVAAQVQAELDEARIAEGARDWPVAIAAAGRARVLARTGEGGAELLGQVDALLAVLEAGAEEDARQEVLDTDNRALIRELGRADRVEGSTIGNDWAAMAEAMHA
ncbi:MAG: serine/threonine-protein kinase, partial [Planctomycetota bacterium]